MIAVLGKNEDGTLSVYADRGWWNYQVEIIFNDVLFSNYPEQLDWNILCRLGTEEEKKHLRSLHDFPPSYNVYCFEDTSEYFRNGRRSFSSIQQEKSFVIAQSVKVTAFFSDRHFDDSFNTWQKGDLADLSERFQKVFLRSIESSISFAKSVEDKKHANPPHPENDKQA